MRSALIIGFAVLLTAALVAPAAQAASQVRRLQVEIGTTATTPPGTLSLDFIFKNSRTQRHRFTPRQLTRIAFSQVPLQCMNASGTGSSQLLLTTTFQTAVKLTKAPNPSGKRPKPGRFAFRFAHTFTAFTGTVRGTIDKANHGPRRLRSQGTLEIKDLDSDPEHMNCSTGGLKQWGGVPLRRLLQ